MFFPKIIDGLILIYYGLPCWLWGLKFFYQLIEVNLDRYIALCYCFTLILSLFDMTIGKVLNYTPLHLSLWRGDKFWKYCWVCVRMLRVLCDCAVTHKVVLFSKAPEIFFILSLESLFFLKASLLQKTWNRKKF